MGFQSSRGTRHLDRMVPERNRGPLRPCDCCSGDQVLLRSLQASIQGALVIHAGILTNIDLAPVTLGVLNHSHGMYRQVPYE